MAKQRVDFRLEGKEFIELDNLLKVTGLCESGGAAKTAIAAGRVTVDGRVELRRRCKLRAGQVVEFEGQTVVVN
jgi:ribosome-associated protein